ncbi:MAG: Gfo/Idh/MocA family protein [Candidatus Hydrogenedentota bacterium]
MSISRRDFLRHTTIATSVAAAGVSINARGANEKVVIGVMGIKGRGNFLGPEFAKREDVEVRYLADPDSRLFPSRIKAVNEVKGDKPKATQNFHEILDDPEVDAVVQATPDHWHALGTILACQAGKDVYVEKPTAHNIWESRKMIEAARKHERVVQVGAQNRSAEYCYQARELIESGGLGDVHFARVLNSKHRGRIEPKPDEPAPDGVDYDMWLGPAPKRPFNPIHFHYTWHWMWPYSGGDIINDGVHQIDIARWMIGKDYPKAVSSAGGKFAFAGDSQDAPTTQTVNWEYDDMIMVFEETLFTPYMKKTPFEMRDTDNLPNWPFSGTRMEIYGTKNIMCLSRHGGGWQVFDGNGESVKIQPGRFSPSNTAHIANFIDCIRSREMPNGDVEKLHLSTLLCQYGNIAYRTGRRLHIDPETEGFKDDDEANSYVKRDYREPYVVPEEV